MARYSIDGSVLDNIANAINEKTGETAAMVPGEMAEKISEIESNNQEIQYTVNWNGDTGGRKTITTGGGVNFYCVSHYLPNRDVVASGMPVGVVSHSGGEITFPLVIGPDSDFGYEIRNPNNETVGGVIPTDIDNEPGIYCISLDAVSQALGVEVTGLRFSWVRTGPIEEADEQLVLASSSPLTLDIGWTPVNYMETINGTIANPWAEINLTGLRNEIQNNNATAYIAFKDGTADVRIFLRYNSAFFGGDCSTFLGASLIGSYYIQYDTSGTLNTAKKYSSNGTASNISNSTATTLTIIHHPLPDSGT